MDEAQHAQGRVRQRGKAIGQAGTLGVVTVFVPPAILDEVQAIFHLPVAANVDVKPGGADRAGVATGDEIPGIVEQDRAIGRAYFAIGADGDLAVGKAQTLTNILGVVEVEPQPAGFGVVPLFSVTSEAGRACEALAKHVFSASRTSGWLALT